MDQKIPDAVASCLWSYDLDKLDVERDKSLIIKQVLDFGSKEATDWVRERYDDTLIRSVIEKNPASAWRSKKSLALWSLAYNAKPNSPTRIVA